jgi:hypothetical protein
MHVPTGLYYARAGPRTVAAFSNIVAHALNSSTTEQASGRGGFGNVSTPFDALSSGLQL